MEDTRTLLDHTLRFALSGIERELRLDIDWRAEGRGRNVFQRAAIYTAAMARDLARIFLHHPDGVAQAKFRVRIQYIERTAVPMVKFFLDHYPLSQHQQGSLVSALTELEESVGLISDGKIPALDEWYATMEEFGELTERCGRAADAIAEAIREPTTVSAAEPQDQ
jgi:hypothetical protein